MSTVPSTKKEMIIIIGAGPAGLAAAFELLQKKVTGKKILILDKNASVGGLARTYAYKGHFFDVGPHRFYTKNQEVLQLWKSVLGKDLFKIKRLTRVLYNQKLFYYPIQLLDVIKKLGIKSNVLCLTSFVYAKLTLRQKPTVSFEDWVVKHFGRKLYTIFFKTYTEKVWGIPCSQIESKWAQQRIKNLNFVEIVKNALFKNKRQKPKSLIQTFYYPKKGAGFFYEKLAQKIEKMGGQILLDTSAKKIYHKNNIVTEVEYQYKKTVQKVSAKYVFSSMPITHCVFALSPRAPETVLKAARMLYYRDHITVNLIVPRANIFPDNWIYVHSPEVKMARVTNYNNFTETQTQKETALSVEYFGFKDDDVWRMSNEELMQLAKNELVAVKLLRESDTTQGFVIRETESYPTYYLGHEEYFQTVKTYLSQFENLQLIGRGGMYKYNNMDHSIYSGILAARNFVEGFQKYNIWNINTDAEYFEIDQHEKSSSLADS